MTFRILDNTGDTVKTFDMTVDEQRIAAQTQFEELVNGGGVYMIGRHEDGARVIDREFDETVVEYVVGRQLSGG